MAVAHTPAGARAQVGGRGRSARPGRQQEGHARGGAGAASARAAFAHSQHAFAPRAATASLCAGATRCCKSSPPGWRPPAPRCTCWMCRTAPAWISTPSPSSPSCARWPCRRAVLPVTRVLPCVARRGGAVAAAPCPCRPPPPLPLLRSMQAMDLIEPGILPQQMVTQAGQGQAPRIKLLPDLRCAYVGVLRVCGRVCGGGGSWAARCRRWLTRRHQFVSSILHCCVDLLLGSSPARPRRPLPPRPPPPRSHMRCLRAINLADNHHARLPPFLGKLPDLEVLVRRGGRVVCVCVEGGCQCSARL